MAHHTEIRHLEDSCRRIGLHNPLCLPAQADVAQLFGLAGVSDSCRMQFATGPQVCCRWPTVSSYVGIVLSRTVIVTGADDVPVCGMPGVEELRVRKALRHACL